MLVIVKTYLKWDVVDCMRHEEEKIAYIAHTSPKKGSSRRCSATGFCARRRMSWHECSIYSKNIYRRISFIQRRLIGKSDAANKLKKGVKS